MRAAALAVLAALVLAATAAAEKPASTSITLDNPSPALGDLVTFTTDPDPIEAGWILLRCYQGDELVLSEVHAVYDDGSAYGYHAPFALGPTFAWESGPAECRAEVRIAKRGSIERSKTIAETSFAVAA